MESDGKSKRIPRLCGKDYPKDTVIVHDFGKGVFVPSIAHFVMKLEAYLRMAKIPYEKCYDETPYTDYRGPKEKKPWIEYNGIEMGDSQLIINYLNKEFNVDLNKHLTPNQKATAWAIQKWMEDSTYWLHFHSRWCIYYDEYYVQHTNFPLALKDWFQKYLAQMTYTVGVGRHSDEEVDAMFRHDLTMLSELLGDKKFLMGDQISEVDCAVYGQLVQMVYTPESIPGNRLIKERLHNLTAYCARIKSLYWPDWDQYVTGKPTR